MSASLSCCERLAGHSTASVVRLPLPISKIISPSRGVQRPLTLEPDEPAGKRTGTTVRTGMSGTTLSPFEVL